MIGLELLFAFIVALVLTGIFAAGFGSRDWDVLLAFFVIVLLASWIGGLWIAPIGPAVGGVFWLPFVIVGIVIALLLVAFFPTSREERMERYYRRARRETTTPAATATESTTDALLAGFGIFFWVLLVGLIVLVIVGYIPGVRPVYTDAVPVGAMPVDDIVEDPVAFYGDFVTAEGVAGAAIGDEAFILWDEDMVDMGQESIVVVSQTENNPDFFIPLENDQVQVSGTVYEFIIADLDSVIDYDLDPDLYIDYMDYPILIADEVIAVE